MNILASRAIIDSRWLTGGHHENWATRLMMKILMLWLLWLDGSATATLLRWTGWGHQWGHQWGHLEPPWATLMVNWGHQWGHMPHQATTHPETPMIYGWVRFLGWKITMGRKGETDLPLPPTFCLLNINQKSSCPNWECSARNRALETHNMISTGLMSTHRSPVSYDRLPRYTLASPILPWSEMENLHFISRPSEIRRQNPELNGNGRGCIRKWVTMFFEGPSMKVPTEFFHKWHRSYTFLGGVLTTSLNISHKYGFIHSVSISSPFTPSFGFIPGSCKKNAHYKHLGFQNAKNTYSATVEHLVEPFNLI